MANEKLTSPISGQWNNSIVLLALGAVLLAPPVFALQLAAINALLPAADAAATKEILFTLAKSLVASIGAGAPLGLIVRSLLLTHGKVQARLDPNVDVCTDK